MNLLASLKNISNATWKTIKTIVLPTVISVGGIIANIGGSLFILPKFVKYITDKDENPESLYASIAIILFTTIVNLATRVPAIFRHFRSDKIHNKEPVALGNVGKSIYLFLRITNYTSAGSMMLSSYLNAITFLEFLAQYEHLDPHEGNAEYFTQSTALLLAFCATAKFGIFTLKKANLNSLYTAHHIENKTLTHDKEAMITLAVASFGTIAVPFLAYYSTINALGKIPKISIPQDLKYSISSIFSLTGTVTHLMTQLPAVYISITDKNKLVYSNKPCWETPIKIALYGFAGVGDFATSNISGFTSVVNTTHGIFGVDPKNPELITFAVVSALSTATLNYFFSVYRGYEDNLKHYHESRGDIYLAIEDKKNPTKEALLSLTEKGEITPKTIYRNSSRSLLFSSTDRPPQEDKKILSVNYAT